MLDQAVGYQSRTWGTTACGRFGLAGSMSCKDWFGLRVRLVEIWLIILGVGSVGAFLDVKLCPAKDNSRHGPAGNLIYATPYLALAAFFLLWAHLVVGWTYNGERAIAKEQEPAVDDVAPEN